MPAEKHLTLRIPTELHEQLNSAAAASNLKVSSYVRRALFASIHKARQPSSKEFEKLAELTEQLRRAGVNLNQIAQKLNRDTTDEGSPELKDLIDQLEELRGRTVRLLQTWAI